MECQVYDPITAEVISMAMQDIVNEMGITVERTSGSPGATDAKDYSCVLTKVDGSNIAYFGNNLQHLGDSLTGSRAIARSFSIDDIHEGDVFIYNDPFSAGALHQADVAVQTPIFVEGRMVGWVFTNIHMADIGGMSASGFTPESRDLYAEGLRMPPVRLMDRGTSNAAVWTLIEANVRTPIVLGDIRSAIAANNVGATRFREVCTRYGLSEFQRYLGINEDLVREVLQGRIRRIPPGHYASTDWIEYDPFDPLEYVPISCDLEVTSKGTLVFDFSESGPQMPGYANGSLGAILGSVISVVLAALLPDYPVNSGVYGCLEVKVGEAGRVTNPTEPVGVSGGHMETGPRCLRASHRALTAAMLSSDDEWIRSRSYALGGITAGVIVLTGLLSAGGRGHAFMLDQQAIGHGALPVGDGVAFGGIDYSIAGREPDVESTEAGGPIMYLWRREIPNSGGAGAYRGGNTLETMFVPWLSHQAEISHSCAGGVVPTMGVAGGYPGGGSYTEVYRDAIGPNFGKLPSKEDLPTRGVLVRSKVARVQIGRYDAVRQVMAGGAGWGDPLLRPHDDVANDVHLGAVTRDAAQGAFGIVLDESGLVDHSASEQLRHQMRLDRGARSPLTAKEIDGRRPPVRFDGHEAACAQCACVLTQDSTSWRSSVLKRTRDLYFVMQSTGAPIVDSGGEFDLCEFVCPECGSLLDMEIQRRASVSTP